MVLHLMQRQVTANCCIFKAAHMASNKGSKVAFIAATAATSNAAKVLLVAS